MPVLQDRIALPTDHPSVVTTAVPGYLSPSAAAPVLQDAIMLTVDHSSGGTTLIQEHILSPAAAPVLQDTIVLSADLPLNVCTPVLGPIVPPAGPHALQDAVVLSPDQDAVLQRVRQGRSVFFTGSAGTYRDSREMSAYSSSGTGKSVLIREIVRVLQDVDGLRPEEVAITALTGVVAINIGGCTIHSFAGFGIGIGTDEKLLDKITKCPHARQRWTVVRTLIIDESKTFFTMPTLDINCPQRA
jgi:hypothetical protein